MTELNARIKQLFPGQRIIGFYIRDCRIIPDEWMVALGQELRTLGFAVIGLLSGEAVERMNLNGLDQVFSVEAEEVEYLDAISCFIVTDFEITRYPQSSRVLACVHATSCVTDPREFPQGLYTTGTFDGYLVGFPFAQRRREIKALWDNFPPPEKNFRPSSEFYLMSYGYPKLDLMRRKFSAERERERERERESTQHLLCPYASA